MDAISIFFEHSNHWTWWIFAIVLFVIELLAPGVFFLWLGLAAIAVGLIVLIAPDLAWQLDFALFAVLGFISAVLGRRYWKPNTTQSSDPTLNQRGAQLIGQIYTLQTAIENNHGRMTVADGSSGHHQFAVQHCCLRSHFHGRA